MHRMSWWARVGAVCVMGGLVAIFGACDGQAQRDAAPAASAALVEGGGDVERGRMLYAASCAACHGATGEGVQGLGKDMTDSPFMDSLSDLELVEFLKVGRAPTDPLNTTGVLMPPKGGNPALTDAQLLDIVAFLRTIHR